MIVSTFRLALREAAYSLPPATSVRWSSIGSRNCSIDLSRASLCAHQRLPRNMRHEPLTETTARPRVALVVHAIEAFGGMDRALTELIERGSDRFEFVVFSATLTPEL